jgi:hypothetical protein
MSDTWQDSFADFIMTGPDGQQHMTGLLPRTTHAGGITYHRDGIPCRVPVWHPIDSEKCPIIPRTQWTTTADMRPYEWNNRYQNGYPACCLAALAGAIEFHLAKTFRKLTKLDWLKAWRSLTGGRGGAAVDTALRMAMTDGFPLADGSGTIRIVEAWDAMDVDAFASGILRGCTGLACHDVHAECVVGLDVSGNVPCVQMVNSWYQGLGGQNWHLFPVDRIELKRYGAILIREVEFRGMDAEGLVDARS